MDKGKHIYKDFESIVPGYKELSFQEARKRFIEYWSIHLPCVSIKKIADNITQHIIYISELRLCEMHLDKWGFTSTKNENYCYFNKHWNTRTMFYSEFVLEFDKPKKWTMTNEEFLNNYAVPGICSAVVKLVENKVPFTIWYCQGMKSPHLRIYEIIPRELNREQRQKIRMLLAQRIVEPPFQQYVDTSLFTEHKVALEFSKHWKYNKMLKLFIEVKYDGID